MSTSLPLFLNYKKSCISSIAVIKQAYAANNQTVKSSAGFFYNAPVKGFVKLVGHSKATTEDKVFILPQLGTLRSLPQVTGNNPTLIVELYPASGALKSVKVANNAADVPALIGAVSSGSSGYISAYATQKEKEAVKHDELAVKTREKDLLEAELAINLTRDALQQWADAKN